MAAIEDITYLVDHLFLPPQLPQKDDTDAGFDQDTSIITQVVAQGAEQFVEKLRSINDDHVGSWERISTMLDNMVKTHRGHHLASKGKLCESITNMARGDALVLHISKQNAGVILRRFPSYISFEYFQASPTAASVTGTVGKLMIQFPAVPRAAMPVDPQFIKSLAALLCALDSTSLDDAIPVTRKAGENHAEPREVTDIRYISELLGGAIQALSPLPNNEQIPTATVQKRLNDHVLWKDAYLPWRRSPIWLIIRVAIQTTLLDYGVAEDSPVGYKAFITFILARVLEQALATSIVSPDRKFCMTAKIARRFAKLDPPQTIFPFEYIMEMVRAARTSLQGSWNKALASESTPCSCYPSPVSTHEIATGCLFPLKHSSTYLSQVVNRTLSLKQARVSFDREQFEATLSPNWLTRGRSRSPPEAIPVTGSRSEIWQAVIEVEAWVAGDIITWLDVETSAVKKVNALRVLITALQEVASSVRETNPQSFSRVFLLMMELWVAMDKTTTSTMPLLLDYSPEISPQCMEPLLLPLLSQMQRLHRIETYLSQRHKRAVEGIPSLFFWSEDSRSFAARYFMDDRGMMSLRDTILDIAKRDQADKTAEWKRVSADYDRLYREAQGTKCEYYTTTDIWGFSHSHHSSSCSRHRLIREYENIHISLFEWPLPEGDIPSRCVVFELRLPQVYGVWRDITYTLVETHSRKLKSTSTSTVVNLASYPALKPYYVSTSPKQRISISSSTKSFLVTHYNPHKKFPCSVEAVIGRHGLRYMQHNQETGQWLTTTLPPIDIRHFCAPQFLTGSYSGLSWTLVGTEHLPNHVISKQSQRALGVSDHEWEAFGHIRSGVELQWRNIMLHLVTGVLDLSDDVVYILIRQAAWQAERSLPAGSDCCNLRVAHQDFSDPSFGTGVLHALQYRLALIRENWEERWTAAVLSIVGCRLFVLTTSSAVRDHARCFLDDLRRVLVIWMEQILKLIKKGANALTASTNVLQNCVIQVAATCRSTYAVDPISLAEWLQNHSLVYIFIRSSIVLNTHSPHHSALPIPLRYLLEQDRIFAIEVASILVDVSQSCPMGFDDAVLSVWENFKRDSNISWKVINQRWLGCQTQTSSNSQVRFVHVDLITGDLLVDGKAQGYLPKDMMQHPLFKTLFPSQVVSEVTPSTMQGMLYQFRSNVEHNEVHFAWSASTDIVIRTRCSDHISEFVPSSKLCGDIPNHLCTGFIHVYDDTARTLNFYPFSTSQRWTFGMSPTWKMHLSCDPHPLSGGFMIEGLSSGQHAVTPDSSLARRVFEVFRCLEDDICDLFITTSCESHKGIPNVSVALPRYGFRFFIDADGSFRSHELPEMTVDTDQGIGTLVGLSSKLVLTARRNDLDKSRTSRVVLIPKGAVSIGQVEYQPRVRITPKTKTDSSHVESILFDVDDLIGRLISRDGTLSSWYFLAYLHILTSSHLPDILTQCAGIQQALVMLKSSRSLTFMRLTVDDREILESIMATVPVRTYYPDHLTSMETVSWDLRLSPLSQSDLLVPYIESIMRNAEDQALFSSNDPLEAIEYSGKETLRSRAAFRSSKYLPAEYLPKGELDRTRDIPILPSRSLDTAASQEKAAAVMQVVADVQRWHVPLFTPDGIYAMFQHWLHFSTEPIAHVTLNSFSEWLTQEPHCVWFTLYELCRTISRPRDMYAVAFTLAVLTHRAGQFTSGFNNAILAFATNSSSPLLQEATSLLRRQSTFPPLDYHFSLESGHKLTVANIEDIAEENLVEFDRDGVTRNYGETETAYSHRLSQARRAHRSLCQSQSSQIARFLIRQWPVSFWSWGGIRSTEYSQIDLHEFQTSLDALVPVRFANLTLYDHAKKLEAFFNAVLQDASPLRPSLKVIPLSVLPTRSPNRPNRAVLKTLADLFEELSPLLPDPAIASTSVMTSRQLTPPEPRSGASEHVSEIIHTLQRVISARQFVDMYTSDLTKCVEALVPRPDLTRGDASRRQVPIQGSAFIHQLQPNPDNPAQQVLHDAGLWPTTSPAAFLRHLSKDLRATLSPKWKLVLVNYAEELCQYQKTKRIAVLVGSRMHVESLKEEQSLAGVGWDPELYPDWLLIQLDANILVRPVQASIALCMMFPSGGQNSAIQLNMGEGKSSVIVPIASTALADGHQLVRVVVLKPLVSQMFEVLKQRVCGLANRRVFFLPFSRDIEMNSAKAARIVEMFKTCARVGGILIAQPEHILSFELLGLDSLCQSGSLDAQTKALLAGQQWLHEKSRDILDESDEILSVRYQLIYTVGTPGPLEAQPTRWYIIQQVLSLLKTVITRMTESLEVAEVESQDAFPRTRILTRDAGDKLLEIVVLQVVYHGKLQSTPFRTYSQGHRDLARRFIMDVDISGPEVQQLKDLAGDFYTHLLLLRGLVAHGIILMCFKEKRWRVDYGLDPSRSSLAVPYRAKDVPSSRAEFGHPDIILVLTCLSYYYGGLDDGQLDITFRCLHNTDNPAARYEEWIKASKHDLPRTLKGLNLSDVEQKTTKVFPHLRYNKSVIDFFLSEWVFPKEARQFQNKLTTNAWDLARKRPKLTTGFSGTNDNRYLLPLSMKQLDLEDQLHTNAEVLGFILQRENRLVQCTGTDGALGLIERVVGHLPPAKALLDVGAQVLELENWEVADKWLEMEKRQEVEAAVYFDPSTDEPHVRTRDGRTESFASSLYKTQLEKVLVYLDEAHTRGTDFKFPVGTHAVVTLGPKLTKDKLVQGCMRMRKLGSDHSVSFFASNEIWRKISEVTTETETLVESLDSRDVLVWTMSETCRQMQEKGAMWASQGTNFDMRCTARARYDADPSLEANFKKCLMEQESHTLEELYGLREAHATVDPSEQQHEIERRCKEFGINEVSGSSALLEEQERELAHEKEDEREVQRARGAEPHEHELSPYLRPFVQHGRTTGFVSLRECLQNTSQFGILLATGDRFLNSSSLRATGDFKNTIKVPPGTTDGFLRVVQWIVSSEYTDTLVLISPYEANIILPEMRTSKTAHLHVYAPRVSRNVPSFEDLSFFAVPHIPPPGIHRPAIHELSLFAGQLFFSDKAVFERVSGMLGLHAIPDEYQSQVDSGGFVGDDAAREVLGVDGCVFTQSPVKFLRELISWRRKGQGFDLTHMRILYGNDLEDDEFDSAGEVSHAIGELS